MAQDRERYLVYVTLPNTLGKVTFAIIEQIFAGIDMELEYDYPIANFGNRAKFAFRAWLTDGEKEKAKAKIGDVIFYPERLRLEGMNQSATHHHSMRGH